jgi:hypothetical protein
MPDTAATDFDALHRNLAAAMNSRPDQLMGALADLTHAEIGDNTSPYGDDLQALAQVLDTAGDAWPTDGTQPPQDTPCGRLLLAVDNLARHLAAEALADEEGTAP